MYVLTGLSIKYFSALALSEQYVCMYVCISLLVVSLLLRELHDISVGLIMKVIMARYAPLSLIQVLSEA